MFLLASAFVKVQGQQKQHYYVYIQSEKGQPFYVKHNGDVLCSTERGYIIIPKLGNGTVPITIGFPGNQAPEQHFDLKVAAKDQGFLLKKATSNAYTLYNLQSFGELKSDRLLAAAGEEKAQAAKEEEQPAKATTTDEKKEMLGKMQEDLNSALGNNATITGGQIKKSPAPKNQGNNFANALDKIVVSGDDRDDDVEEAKPAPTAKPAAGKKVAEVAAPSEVTSEKTGKDRGTLTDEEKALLASVMAEESKTAASEAAAADVAKAAPVQGDGEEAPKKSKHAKKRENNPDFIEFQDDKSAATTAPATTAPVEVPASTEEQPAPSRKKRKEKSEVRAGEIVTDTSGYGVAVYDEPSSSRKKKRKADAEADVATAAVPVAAPEAGVAVEASPRKKKHKSDEEVVATENTTPAVDPAAKRLVNSDCGNIMDDGTFRKMLRKFVASSSDEGMLDIFRKQSRNYCMETSQIKTLAQLVVGEDARYRLLDMAYSKTYDTEKYGSLESVLTDNYYKGRFKAMLHK
ncbi:uncharacterized protein DUF4476 [Chitinophaga dinghuensis]|uniref:Uncharacterized protein DUF4476 n=1 Tax=Chitinophaga dinghuensis TaxID=1539050 RepID=A0A327WF54_9BACT|nr:DUF4476 domain-containing protein [Chitinophaga dinghuensis]RAJ86056.1 uncharacterized protein DUF4476 [Chitinophaga dinghuensis]